MMSPIGSTISLVILAVALLPLLSQAAPSVRSSHFHQGLPQEHHPKGGISQPIHQHNDFGSQPNDPHLDTATKGGARQTDQEIQILFPAPDKLPVSSLIENAQPEDGSEPLPRSSLAELFDSRKSHDASVSGEGGKLLNTGIKPVLHAYKTGPKSSTIGATRNQIEGSRRLHEKLWESDVSQGEHQLSDHYEKDGGEPAGSNIPLTSPHDDDSKYQSAQGAKNPSGLDNLSSRTSNSITRNVRNLEPLKSLIKTDDATIPRNSMQSKTYRKRRRHASYPTLLNEERRDDVKMTSYSLNRPSRSTDRDYRPMGTYFPSVYSLEPGIFPEDWELQRAAWQKGNNPWVVKKARRRLERPRCDLRNITREMLLEYFMTGKMCGSSVVRIRFGLGR